MLKNRDTNPHCWFIRRSFASALSLLVVFIILSACSLPTGFEPSPEELIALLLEFPPVPTPPVTPENEGTSELESAQNMGQGYINVNMTGFRSLISLAGSVNAHSLDDRNGYRWEIFFDHYGRPYNSIELIVWFDEHVHFELDIDDVSQVPTHYYSTEGWFTPSFSDGELYHRVIRLAWNTDDVGLKLEMNEGLTRMAACDSSDGGGRISHHVNSAFFIGSSVHWDAGGNFTFYSWPSHGIGPLRSSH